MGIAGYGQITGDKYQGTGVTRSNVSFWTADYPYHLTYVNNFRMIGAGPGNNFTVHEVTHVTVNANGDVTSQIDTYSADCK